jgi:hypothetical protein
MEPKQKKALMKEQKLPLTDAWALVAMADRINNEKYVKFPEMDHDTGNVTVRPNREIIKDQIALGLVNITPADREFGLKMETHFQGLAFTALTQSLGDFDQKILNFITQNEVDAGMGMAYLACMAVRYRREVEKEHRAETLFKIGSSSSWQGNVGERVALKVSVLSKFAGKVFAGSVVRATDGANLYFWTSSQTVDMWPDAPEAFDISGVVKAHGMDRDSYQETRLTRVKILI